MTERTVWTGKSSDLLGALDEMVGEKICKTKTWPATPRALSGRIRRAATFLRKVGIDITFDKQGRARTRMIHISAAPENAGAQPSAPSAPHANLHKPLNSKEEGADGMQTVADGGDVDADGRGEATFLDKALKSKGADGADGADAKSKPYSATWKTPL